MRISITFWVGLIVLIIILWAQLNKSKENIDALTAEHQRVYDSLAYEIEVDRGIIDVLNETITHLEREDTKQGKTVAESVKKWEKKKQAIPDTIEVVPIETVNELVKVAQEIIDNQAEWLEIKDRMIGSLNTKIEAQERIIINQDIYIEEKSEEVKEWKKEARKQKRKGTLKAIGGVAVGVLIALL